MTWGEIRKLVAEKLGEDVAKKMFSDEEVELRKDECYHPVVDVLTRSCKNCGMSEREIKLGRDRTNRHPVA